MDKNERIEELREIISAAKDELYDLESASLEEDNRGLIGKCFRYKNRYGASEKEWWLYGKVVCVDGRALYLFEFEETSNGEINIRPRDINHVRLHDGWNPIKSSEFTRAWRKLKNKISTLDKD